MVALLESKRKSRADLWAARKRLVGSPPIIHTRNVNLLLYAKAYMWFHKVAEFRQTESELLYKSKPHKAVQSQHRRIIGILVEEGKEIVRQIHANGGLIKPENGFSIDDVISGVEELQNTLLQWYGGMSRKRKKEILEGLFDASK
jgi:hypothetical protein